MLTFIKKMLSEKSVYRFIAVGCLCTIIDFIIYMLIIDKVGAVYGKTISMLCSVIVNFILNKFWSFSFGHTRSVYELLKYITSQGINIAINVFVNYFILSLLERKVVAFVFATGIAMIVNYLLQKFWVFNEGDIREKFARILKNGIFIIRENKKSFIFMVIVLILLTVFPTYEGFYNQTHKTVAITDTTNLITLQQGDSIEQRIIVRDNAEIERFFVHFYANNNVDEGLVRITLTQEGIKHNFEIDTRSIYNDEYYEVDKGLNAFKTGEVVVNINVVKLAGDNVIGVWNSMDTSYGLPPVLHNGAEQAGALSMSYIQQLHDRAWKINVFIVLLMILTIFAAAFVMLIPETPASGWALTFLNVFLIVEFVSLVFPPLTYGGIAWAEGVVTFYDNAVKKNAWECITSLEGNMYLSEYNSIVSLIAVQLLGLRHNLFVILQYVSLFVRALCLAPFCSHYFRNIFSRPVRFVLSYIGICMILSDYFFIGTAYCGLFFVIILMTCNYEKISNIIFALALVIACILCMSKMLFVVFVPGAFILLALNWKKINLKKKIALTTIGTASLCEAVFSILLKNGLTEGNKLGTLQIVSLTDLVEKVIYYTFQSFSSVLWQGISKDNQLLLNTVLYVLITGIFIFSVIQVVSKKRYERECVFILALFSIIAGNCGVEILTSTGLHGSLSWNKVVLVPISGVGGHMVYATGAAIGILLACVHIFLDYLKFQYGDLFRKNVKLALLKKRTIMAFSLVLLFFIVSQYPKGKEENYMTNMNYIVGDWKTYEHMLDDEFYVIQIDPDHWFYIKNASNLRVSLTAATSTVSVADYTQIGNINTNEKFIFYAEKDSITNQVLDRYYYMTLYDENGSIISTVRQMNDDPQRYHMAFYLDRSATNISSIAFTYEDGSPAKITGILDIGYR